MTLLLSIIKSICSNERQICMSIEINYGTKYINIDWIKFKLKSFDSFCCSYSFFYSLCVFFAHLYLNYFHHSNSVVFFFILLYRSLPKRIKESWNHLTENLLFLFTFFNQFFSCSFLSFTRFWLLSSYLFRFLSVYRFVLQFGLDRLNNNRINNDRRTYTHM